MPYMDPNRRGDKDWSAPLPRSGGPGPMRRESDGIGATQEAQQPTRRDQFQADKAQSIADGATQWKRGLMTEQQRMLADQNRLRMPQSSPYSQPAQRPERSAVAQASTPQNDGLPSRWRTFTEEGLTGLQNRPDANPAQFPESRFASPRTPGASAAPRAPTAAAQSATGRTLADSPVTGPTIPGGGRPSAVSGIFRREGEGGVPEFYNLRADGSAPAPLSRGTVSIAPAGSLGNMTTPQATTDAVRAAAARGDWSALERTGRMAPRSGGAVGGAMGGAPRIQAPDQFAQAEQLRKQAQSLYQQAGRVRGGSNKSPLIREANMLSSMAESLIGAGATMSGQQAALDQEAMKQNATMQKALAGAPMSPADMADIRKTLSEAGLNDARSAEIMKQLTDPERGNLLPFDIGSEDMTALTTALGRDGFAEYLTNALKQEEINTAMGVLKSVGIPLTELIAAAEAGESLPPSIMQALGTVGVGKPMAMGGLVTNDFDSFNEPMGYAEGGMVDYDDALGPMLGMDQGMPEMGAMDSMGLGMGMGEPQADPVQMEYEQYAQVAESMGLPVIPFEQFAQIMQQAQQPEMPPDAGAVNLASGGLVPTRNQFGFEMDPQTGRSPVGQAGWERYNAAVGGNNAMRQQAEENNYSGVKKFARGGPVDVGGKMVVDPNPAAATDSIPAMIDGQQPAALDSGEFVIPRHAVMFHGIDKLTKLIAQADQNGSGPGQAPRG